VQGIILLNGIYVIYNRSVLIFFTLVLASMPSSGKISFILDCSSNPSGGQDFPPVQTGPGAHLASCKMGTGSFPGVMSSRGVTLTPHCLLVPWSWKGTAIPLLPLWAVRPVQTLSACTRAHFTFFTLKVKVLCSFQTSGTTHPLIQHHIPVGLYTQTHCCENLRTVTYYIKYLPTN